MAAMCSRRCCWLLALTAVFALGMPAAFAQDGAPFLLLDGSLVASVALPFNQNNTPFTAAECTAFASSLVAGLNSASLEHQSTTITPNVTSLACYTDTELGTPRIRVVLEVDDATFAAVKVSDEASSTIPTTLRDEMAEALSSTRDVSCLGFMSIEAVTGAVVTEGVSTHTGSTQLFACDLALLPVGLTFVNAQLTLLDSHCNCPKSLLPTGAFTVAVLTSDMGPNYCDVQFGGVSTYLSSQLSGELYMAVSQDMCEYTPLEDGSAAYSTALSVQGTEFIQEMWHSLTNGTHVGSMASALIRPLVCNTSMLAVGNITQLRAAGLLEGVSEVDAATGGEALVYMRCNAQRFLEGPVVDEDRNLVYFLGLPELCPSETSPCMAAPKKMRVTVSGGGYLAAPAETEWWPMVELLAERMEESFTFSDLGTLLMTYETLADRMNDTGLVEYNTWSYDLFITGATASRFLNEATNATDADLRAAIAAVAPAGLKCGAYISISLHDGGSTPALANSTLVLTCNPAALTVPEGTLVYGEPSMCECVERAAYADPAVVLVPGPGHNMTLDMCSQLNVVVRTMLARIFFSTGWTDRLPNTNCSIIASMPETGTPDAYMVEIFNITAGFAQRLQEKLTQDKATIDDLAQSVADTFEAADPNVGLPCGAVLLLAPQVPGLRNAAIACKAQDDPEHNQVGVVANALCLRCPADEGSTEDSRDQALEGSEDQELMDDLGEELRKQIDSGFEGSEDESDGSGESGGESEEEEDKRRRLSRRLKF